MRSLAVLVCVLACGGLPLVQAAPTTAPAPTSRPAATQPAVPTATQPALAGMEDLRRARQMLVGPGPAPSTQRLDELAQRADELAREAPVPAAQREVRQIELEVYAHLAQRAAAEQQPEAAGRRARQIRTAAVALVAEAGPEVGLQGEFWLLQADLIELNSQGGDLAARQARVSARLEKFVAGREPADPAQRRLLTEVKLALLRVYDQRGLSRKAADLVAELRRSGALEEAQKAGLEAEYAHLEVLGQRFDARLRLPDGKTWSSAEQAGKVVLIHYYGDAFAPSGALVEDLRKVQAQLGPRGLALLSVRMEAPGPAGTPPPRPDWPVFPDGAGQVSLGQLFHVQSLPRFALIDRQGHIAAIGGSLGIVEQVEELLRKPAAATQP